MYFFFVGDNGCIYCFVMFFNNFFGNFGIFIIIIFNGVKNDFFEVVQVYIFKDFFFMIYFMIIELIGVQGCYFCFYIIINFGGLWIFNVVSESNFFVGKVNSGMMWLNDISYGDLVWLSNDERFEVDLCNLQLLYQGRLGNSNEYNLLLYRFGLLMLMNLVGLFNFNFVFGLMLIVQMMLQLMGGNGVMVLRWGQCGGQGYIGLMRCEVLYMCMVFN